MDNSSEKGDHSQVLSDYGRMVFEVVNFVTISSVIGMFGICSNIINIIIFIKHKFTESMTVSLLGLSVSDLIGLILLQSFNVCVNPLFVRADIPFYPPEVQYITVGWPHVCFTRITCLITVFVAIERCLCIKIPLKVKMILTPKRSFIVVSTIYTVMMVGMTPTYLSVRIGKKYVKQRNRTLLGLIEAENREAIEAITIALNVLTQVICFVGIIGSNAVLITALREKTKWRQTATGTAALGTSSAVAAANSHNETDSPAGETDHARNAATAEQTKAAVQADPPTQAAKKGGGAGQGGAAEHATQRDRKLGRMIVLLSAIVFICYLPSTMCLVFMMIYPEFSIMGREVNVFFMAWSWVFVFDATNSSANIFIYYNMSSKYRATFHSLFGWVRKGRRVGPAKDPDHSNPTVNKADLQGKPSTDANDKATKLEPPATQTTPDTKSSSAQFLSPNAYRPSANSER